MKRLLLPLHENLLWERENRFILFSFFLHLLAFTAVSYAPVATRPFTPVTELDMINTEVQATQPDTQEIEQPREVAEVTQDTQYLEQKVVPLHTARASFYVPIFEVSIPPKVKNWVEPEYPLAARQAGIEGSLIVEVDIDEDGTVAEARIIRSAGHGFDEEALKAVKKTRFNPAIKGTSPVPVRVRLPIRFELE